MPRCPSCIVAVLVGLGLALVPLDWSVADLTGNPQGMALAQDDDDDDGGDDDTGDDDDGDDSGGGGGNDGGSGADDDATGDDDDDQAAQSPREVEGNGAGVTPDSPAQAAPKARAPRVATPRRPPPSFAPEIVVSDLTDADLDLLLAEGFTLTERRRIATLAVTLDRLAPPPGVSLSDARSRVRALSSGQDADFNHYYRNSADDCTHENCPAWQMIGWQPNLARVMQPDSYMPAIGPALPRPNLNAPGLPELAATASAQTAPPPPLCGPPVAIGLIDTGINPEHDILKGARLDLIPRETGPGSGAVHGTAVVSLLLGQEGSRVPGLLPQAEVLAVDVFRRDQGEERADVVDLIEGLDILAGRQVRLYSLSLAGPENAVLTRMLDRLTDPAGLDAVIVAAAGNGGPAAAPSWPAAHPAVLAVTAVDKRGRIYENAQRGDHLALSAPGVGLLAATSIRGARAKTGTSFAVPFVTAAAALVLGTGVTAADARAALLASARDLGAPGRDPIFGHGLVSLDALCGETPASLQQALE